MRHNRNLWIVGAGNRWCVENCDPTKLSCGSGSCIYVGDGFHCGTPGAKQYGEQCFHGGECDAGMICAALPGVPGCEGVSCCTPFCVDGEDSTCPGFGEGQQCVTGLQVPDAFNHVGVCTWP
ncbi:hypothetical protein ENSA7_38530 [Enhygromyxa salina]|uniref:Uncharacterized protein n=1 Tax=Enhygromyxa salina TaxID=215803 RepID=A0A2S9YN61_9BACT|nr:hypothetical protein ENSA7_38530 [Enhygromyxa salina]